MCISIRCFINFLIPLFFISTMPLAHAHSISQTQSQLKLLDTKIKTIKQSLDSAHDKRGLLNKELSGTEKEIGYGIKKLQEIQQAVSIKERKISELQTIQHDLNQQIVMQQKLLADHIRVRYQIGEYQPLKWLLNQDNPYKISRILSYYKYIITSRQHSLTQIADTQKKIQANTTELHHELAKNQKLHQQLSKHQHLLLQNKRYHNALIQSLNQDITNKQARLKEFETNKTNLSKLLLSLTQNSLVQNSKPFAHMRKKLPLPLPANRLSVRRMNQGVTFFAEEGAVVHAIYPGKVVFSDWLKGYGLLLIIDHGQGYMSLYAHNQSLFKNKGQHVNQSDPIASVGHSGGIRQNGLYFEIRSRGKAISPLEWFSNTLK